MKPLFLIGYMGCGKSTLGRKLARRLGIGFVDTDTLVEEQAGAPVADVFRYEGEARFREAEREALERAIAAGGEAVVSTGGGLPTWGDNMQRMNGVGHTVFLRRSAAQIASRLSPYGRRKRPRLRGLDDAGLLQAASIPKLSHIQIDHTAVTYEGLLAIADNSRIEPVAHVQFTKEQMERFSQLQREKAKKPTQLDEQAAAECRRVLSAFFAEMTEWEQYMEQAGFEDAEAVPRLLAIWEKYVSEKPRPGYRPLGLSYSAQGTYSGEEFLDAEQITKNKLYIYTREKNTGFDRRFLMKRVNEGWRIDAMQERLDGWQRTGL